MNTNLSGLETVIRRLVQSAEARLEAAQAAAAQVCLGEIEDLEAELPSSSVVCADEQQKADRELVAPWFRFLWEVYRTVLDILRHNSKLEGLYREVAEGAFSWCQRWGRKSEFRRLCEILRHHLSLIEKYPNQQHGVDLATPESHRLQLELRFAQLKLATGLELWQEAFRTIEDIHGLFVKGRRAADPQLVRTYYEHIGQIFAMSDNYLFLAATWSKLHAITTTQALGSEQTQNAARLFLLATLSVPLMEPICITSSLAREERELADKRLAEFLGLQRIPSAASLASELESRGVVAQTGLPELLDIHRAIRSGAIASAETFSQLASKLRVLEGDELLKRFVVPIHANLVALLFKIVSKKERSVPLTRFSDLITASGLECASSFDLDGFILQGCKTGDFVARIDGRTGSVLFERPCFERPETDLAEEMVKSESALLLARLDALLAGNRLDVSALRASGLAALDTQHASNLQRKMDIERRKEALEAAARQREQDEQRERARRSAAEQEARAAKELDEARDKARQRLEAERESIRKEQAALRLAEIEAAKAKLQKTKDAEKLVAAFKRLDYLERAMRQEERPLLAADYEKQKTTDLQAHEERTRLILERSKAKHTTDLEVKQHLTAMSSEYQAYLANVKTARLAELEGRRATAATALEAAKEARRQQTIALLRQRHDQQLAAEQLRAERAEQERQALERARYEREEAIARQTAAAAAEQSSRPSPFGSRAQPSASSAFGSSTRPSAFGSSTRPSAFASSPAPVATNASSGAPGKYIPPSRATATSPAVGGDKPASPFGSAWRGSAADAPRDSKSVFGSSSRKQ
jgi:translation initiation factor 3 subunit A